MRSYLAKFQNVPAQAAISFEKALPEEPSKPSKLGFAGFDGSPHRTFQNNYPAGTCPQCHELANLQQRAGDVWYCPGCRLWMHGDGSPLPKVERPRPFSLERQEAERLAADLLAAGCSFVPDEFDGEWNVRLPVKISAALLTRFECADRKELQLAIGKLAELEEANGWVN